MNTRSVAFWLALLTVVVAVGVAEFQLRKVTTVTALSSRAELAFLAHERDDHGRVTGQVLGLHATAEPAAPGRSIFVIGGSTLREGLLPDALIARRLQEAGFADIHWHTLSTFDQSMAESARISLNLPLRSGDVVAININPRRFGFEPRSLADERYRSRLSLLPHAAIREVTQRMAAVSVLSAAQDAPISSLLSHRTVAAQWLRGRYNPRARQAWRELGSGDFSAANIRDLFHFKPRRIRRALRYAYGDAILDDAAKSRIARQVRQLRVPQYMANADFGVALLEALIVALQERGVLVSLLELPRSVASVEAYGPVWNDYEVRVQRLVEKANVIRTDLRGLRFDDALYYDLEHLRKPARGRLTDAVAGALVKRGQQP